MLLGAAGCCTRGCQSAVRQFRSSAASAAVASPRKAQQQQKPPTSPAPQQQQQSEDPKAASLRAVKVTSAIRAYLKSAENYDKFIRMERENFELGKRFLASILGVSVADLTQENIEKAIQYLFPSALQCDYTGRPNHSMFYMKQPNFYQLLSDIAWKVEQLKRKEDEHLRAGRLVPARTNLDLSNSHWLDKQQIEKRLLETVSDAQYSQAIAALEFLVAMPLSAEESEFIMQYRNVIVGTATELPLPELQFDEATQRPYSEAYGQRKWATASCRLYSGGIGRFTVNGESILEAFPLLADREALASPLVVTGMLGKVDIDATVTVSSPEQPEGRLRVRTRVDDVAYMASQAGALRLAIARAIACHLPTKQLRDRLRMSGLLTPDMRLPERFYYGQDGPRAKVMEQHWQKTVVRMLGPNVRQQICNRLSQGDSAQRLFIFGCIVLILTASTQPQMMLHQDRISSFSSSPASLVNSLAVAEQLASNGLFYDASGGLICFHCSVRLQSGSSDPLQQHLHQRPRCYLQKLLRLAAGSDDKILLADVAADHDRFDRALRRLHADLKSSTSVQFAQTFGLSPELLQFAATRHFMRNGGSMPNRAGDLIELAHECSDQVHPSLLQVQIVHILAERSPNEAVGVAAFFN
uniref:DNA-directed RNA polymerase n=1 Tax=Macrostomum lignano TaxID=282301 RepID=A0A1I8IL90_9PLAT